MAALNKSDTSLGIKKGLALVSILSRILFAFQSVVYVGLSMHYHSVDMRLAVRMKESFENPIFSCVTVFCLFVFFEGNTSQKEQ